MSIVPKTSTQNRRYVVFRWWFASLFLILATVALPGCDVFLDSGGATGSPSNQTHFGECMLREPTRTAPDQFQSLGIVETTDYPPFTKAVSVDGLTFVANDAIPNAFIDVVAQSTREMLSQNGPSPTSMQRAVSRALYEYKAVLPVLSQEQIAVLFTGQDSDIEALRNQNSVCDVIIFQSEHQVIEVVEHVLHAISVIGLHHAFPNEWGISTDSALYQHMQVAIENGYFDPSSYEMDIADSDTYLRVTMQEFGYWAITTSWGLQQRYGPGKGEWFIRTPEELAALLPELDAMIEKTIGQFMMPPSDNTLSEIDNLF